MPNGAGPFSNGRRFFNTLIWIARSGARWRDLPERYGGYQTVERCHYRGADNGVLDAVFGALAQEADLNWGRPTAPASGRRLRLPVRRLNGRALRPTHMTADKPYDANVFRAAVMPG